MKKKSIIILLGGLLLSSCTIKINLGTSQSETSSTDSSEFNSISSSSNVVNSSSSVSSKDEALNYEKINRDDVKYTMTDTNSQLGWYTTKSVGNQKFLVIPVELKDGPKWTSTMLDELNTAFFGKSEDTAYESVSSFYYKSSYGKLNITGEVSSVYSLNMTINALDSYGNDAPNYVISKYYNATEASLLKKYDLNSDGYVDNAIFIYSNDYKMTSDTAYWAWCHVASQGNYLYSPNANKPAFNSYMWASYAFMNDKYQDGYNYNKVDAHTYIHESGHMLGLDDYYCYDDTNAWNPAGELEMQSYNVGDQNAYSKFALGWINPYYVKGDTTIKLKTSALYDEAILINDDWNKSIFDEYLFIEYYTNQGLNEIDAKHQYNGRDKMYNYNGLRIYHVDARLVKLNSMGNFVSYADDIDITDSNYIYYVGASNSYSNSYLSNAYKKIYRYLHLLDQGGNNKINNGYGGYIDPSTTLWTGSKKFQASSTFFNNGTRFNAGNEVGYTISVSNLTSEECTVTIIKN